MVFAPAHRAVPTSQARALRRWIERVVNPLPKDASMSVSPGSSRSDVHRENYFRTLDSRCGGVALAGHGSKFFSLIRGQLDMMLFVWHHLTTP